MLPAQNKLESNLKNFRLKRARKATVTKFVTGIVGVGVTALVSPPAAVLALFAAGGGKLAEALTQGLFEAEAAGSPDADRAVLSHYVAITQSAPK